MREPPPASSGRGAGCQRRAGAGGGPRCGRRRAPSAGRGGQESSRCSRVEGGEVRRKHACSHQMLPLACPNQSGHTGPALASPAHLRCLAARVAHIVALPLHGCGRGGTPGAGLGPRLLVNLWGCRGGRGCSAAGRRSLKPTHPMGGGWQLPLPGQHHRTAPATLRTASSLFQFQAAQRSAHHARRAGPCGGMPAGQTRSAPARNLQGEARQGWVWVVAAFEGAGACR